MIQADYYRAMRSSGVIIEVRVTVPNPKMMLKTYRLKQQNGRTELPVEIPEPSCP
jgi:hypothetical protein